MGEGEEECQRSAKRQDSSALSGLRNDGSGREAVRRERGRRREGGALPRTPAGKSSPQFHRRGSRGHRGKKKGLVRPAPVADCGEIVAEAGDVLLMFGEVVAQELLEVGAQGSQARHAIHDVSGQVEAIEIVEHGHVEGGGRGAFLLIATNVQIGVVLAAIGEAVNQPRIAVIGKDDGLV